MQNATGEYIIHCDSDDWVDVEMYESMYEKGIKDDSDVVICNYIETDGESFNIKNIGLQHLGTEAFISDMFYKSVSWALWNKLVRRDLLEYVKNYPCCNMGEDLALIAQIFIGVKKLSFVDSFFYKYFVNEQSLTRNMSIESAISCFHQAKSNCDIVLKAWESCEKYSLFYNELCSLQFFIKSRLLQYSADERCKSLYYSTYGKCDWTVIFDKHVNFNLRLRCLLAKIRVYPILKKL